MAQLFFMGTGKMATAIAGGLVKKNVFESSELCGFDINPAAAAEFTKATGVPTVTTPADALAASSAVLIAVKPQMITAALEQFKEILKDKLILSIAAGISIAQLAELTTSSRIIRIMPNTPALVGCGAAAFTPSQDAGTEDIALAGKIFSAVGIAIQLKESDMDAVTALSGSGPAYAFEFIQALADGGVAEGLSRETALKLAAQTLLGAAMMVIETGEHPGVLKDKVTSPAGTTSRALEVLAERGFSGTVIQAVRAAAKRSKELGKN